VEAGGRREAFYTNLPPGTYRFRVSAATQDGSWTEAAQPVSFTLRPYFYQTRWFFLSLLLSAAGIAWIAFRLRLRHFRLQMRAVLAERSRIARELHDTLIQGFSGVTMQLQALMARLKHSPERETLEDIIHDAGACLREARHSVAGLRNSAGDESGLAAAVAQAARHITEGGELLLQLRMGRCPSQLGPDIEYNILRIAQEAVTNAMKHSSGRKVEVELNCASQQLVLTIRDDGVGFDTRLIEPSLPGHYGLIGMRERAAQIGGQLNIVSEAGRGTTVELKLPLSPAASMSANQSPQTAEHALETSK
jgi:signal transduction histidine kinase